VGKKTKERKMELKRINDDEIKNAFSFQKEKSNWTFYNEREFMENLLQTRFNFLITVYAIFCNSYFGVSDNKSKIIILILGLSITILMWFPIYRIYKKVDILLTILHKLGTEHTSPMIAKEFGKSKIFPRGVNCFMGIGIPLAICLSFVVGIIYYYFCKK
jgi:hypothetical protein